MLALINTGSECLLANLGGPVLQLHDLAQKNNHLRRALVGISRASGLRNWSMGPSRPVSAVFFDPETAMA